MKKLLTLSLALLLILSFPLNGLAQSVSQDNNIDRNEISLEIWSQYRQLDEFKRHYKENPEGAKAMVERIIDYNVRILNEKNYSISRPMSGNGSISLIYYPEFKQKYRHYCGPASALTAIYGMSKENSVKGSSYDSKQETLANNMKTQPPGGDGTYVFEMTDELNKYSSHEYGYYESPKREFMRSVIDGSLLSDNAPILHASTEKFGYYNGYKTGHYVTIVFANSRYKDSEVGGLSVMDNNRNNNYYGTRDISFDEAYNAIRKRFLIGVTF